jgi:hypothetical protein
MIFPRLPLLQMEFEGMWGHYFAIRSELEVVFYSTQFKG